MEWTDRTIQSEYERGQSCFDEYRQELEGIGMVGDELYAHLANQAEHWGNVLVNDDDPVIQAFYRGQLSRMD